MSGLNALLGLLVRLLCQLLRLLLQLLYRLLRAIDFASICLDLDDPRVLTQMLRLSVAERSGGYHIRCSRCLMPARPSSGPCLLSASLAGPAYGALLRWRGFRCLWRNTVSV